MNNKQKKKNENITIDDINELLEDINDELDSINDQLDESLDNLEKTAGLIILSHLINK